jgi:hypothetical protein
VYSAPVPAAASPPSCSRSPAYADSMLLPANAVVDRELRSSLGADAAIQVRFFSEALDLSWFPDKEVERATFDLLRAKYANRNLALVIPVGPPAVPSTYSVRRVNIELPAGPMENGLTSRRPTVMAPIGEPSRSIGTSRVMPANVLQSVVQKVRTPRSLGRRNPRVDVPSPRR